MLPPWLFCAPATRFGSRPTFLLRTPPLFLALQVPGVTATVLIGCDGDKIDDAEPCALGLICSPRHCNINICRRCRHTIVVSNNALHRLNRHSGIAFQHCFLHRDIVFGICWESGTILMMTGRKGMMRLRRGFTKWRVQKCIKLKSMHSPNWMHCH